MWDLAVDLILEILSSWDSKKGLFQFLVTFLAVFFWSLNCIFLVCKLYLLFQTILNLWLVLILEIFSGWNIKKGQFRFLLFWLFFLVCKLYKSRLYILIFWGFLVFSFLVFSVLSILSLFFLAIFLDLEMWQFWSVNYICPVCKFYFHFGHVHNSGQLLYFRVFSKQWKCPTSSFCIIYIM